ncbi:Cysteine--tRNA ligase [uncultured archaeon]|nr:Cysteine--tRNA ligase [uncultured archaeon]
MQLYNTLTRRKETFKPIHDREVGMYACGPTVYYSAHIGNLRAYVAEDTLKRALVHEGYKVKHVINITDVGHLVSDADIGEDKIRVATQREHKSAEEVASFYTNLFVKDIKLLNVEMPDVMPNASKHITDILALIKKLDEKGYLYKVPGPKGGMYFDTSKFKGYGALAKTDEKDFEETHTAGFRVERPEGVKNPSDFAVWRFVGEDVKDLAWDSEWGRGFPGWHIECSAMGMKYLGQHFDIHCGGIDHIPIHHPNEIAQSEAATGEKFVNYWIHVEFVKVDGQKMSKSLKNIYTIQDLVDKGYSPLGYRYLALGTHYRKPFNFTFESLKRAENNLSGIYVFLQKMVEREHEGAAESDKEAMKKIESERKAFFEAVRNDLDTPRALMHMQAVMSSASHEKNYGDVGKDEANLILEAFREFDGVLGLDFGKFTRKLHTSEEVKRLIDEREKAREAGDFEKSDRIRDTLKNGHGVILEDTKQGIRFYYACLPER